MKVFRMTCKNSAGFEVTKSATVTVDSTTTPPNTGSGSSNTGSSGGGLVKCGTYDAAGNIPNPCDFNDVMDFINRIVTFIFTGLAIPFAAIMFAYAGFELMTSGGASEKMAHAKNTFLNVAIGLIIVAAAFLIVQTVLGIVGYQTTGWNWFGF
jgi:amino acid transporter